MKSKTKFWFHKNIWYILAFIIPFVVAVTAFICQGMWPFGDRGISIIDSYHQYVPFFSELQYKWRHLDSLLYSWNGGLGMNFWAVVAYYLASPLNLLLLIFPKSMVMECFSFIYFIKIGLAGVSFAYFLRKRFHHYGFSITVFGCCYALSSFVIGYAWNIMWLDCIVLFPMVMLGIHRLIQEGRGWLYGIALAVCIFTNYYISIMICIFACLDVLVEISCAREVGVGKKLRRMFGFAGYSLLGGAFGAVMLLPTMYALMASQSASSSFPSTLKFYHNIFELLCQQFTAVEPTCLEGNFNLYCGVSMLLLVPMYLFNKKTETWEKIVRMLVTAFLLVSLNTNYLAYIWHGFHFPNGLPGRFSFIYIFMLLMMGYEGYRHRKDCPKWAVILPAAGWLAFLGYSWWSGRAELEMYTWIINIVLLVLYGAWFTLVCGPAKKKPILEIGLLAVMMIEACAYGAFGLCMNGTVNRKDYYSDQKAVSQLRETIEEREGENFYRVELEERRGRDDVTWHHLPGMSLFSSTANAGVDHLAKRLGFYAVTNKYSYQGATPETDAFLNIDYLISKHKEERIRTFDWFDTVDDRNLYQNHCALGLGFMVSENILQWDYEKTNPFEVINQLMLSATGEELRPYRYFGMPEWTAEGCELTTDSWADWSYTAEDGVDGTVTYVYTSEKSQDLYMYFKAAHCTKVEVIRDEESKSYSDEDGHIFHVGEVEAGETVTLIFHLDDAYDKGNIKLIAAEHDMDVFYQIYDKLKEQRWVTDKVTSTSLSGNITAAQDGVMFTSIPYDKGWTITVDGEKIEPEKIADAFIGISLSKGEHRIEMKYCPEGFIPGLILTCAAGILFVLMYLKEKRDMNRRKNPENIQA
ncbi:YfhO family protein [Frisingicoccus sp.]|uniref:YfhO family protein n=1 Tax=Frisingicoccus sp. TaxID=1918627 RepID=UPI003993CC25